MAELDALAPNYRRAQQRWSGAPMLAECYEALNLCFSGHAHGLVEHVKSFLESVCLTIMSEYRREMPSSTPTTTELLIAALAALGLENARGTSRLDKVLSAFNRLADALTEMRNEHGPVAHGKDGFLDPVAVDHARAFLHTGDAILGVLLNALEGKQPDLVVTREPYESFAHFNERIDRAVSIEARIDEDGANPIVVLSVATGMRSEAIELRAEPSRLLYGIDREAYIEVLKASGHAVARAEEEAESEAAGSEGVEAPGLEVASSPGPVVEQVTAYKGVLETVRSGVEGFLTAEGLDPEAAGGGETLLIDSILATAEQNMALDWKRREAIQARLKVACRRVLVRFGVAPEKAAEVAERLVTWFRVQVPDLATTEAAALAAADGSHS